MATGYIARDLVQAEETASVRLLYRRLRDSQNPMELEEQQFQSLFRISRGMGIYLVQRLSHRLQRRRRHGLSVLSQILTAVRFYAVGSYQRGIGREYDLAVSQPSVSRCVSMVSQAIHEELLGEWIKFPMTRQERLAAKQKFLNARQPFPGAIGAIDCTHVAIIAPVENEEAAFNHHGYHSMNVQMICDPDKVILNVNARYPGARHDSFIWANSSVKRVMELWYARGERRTWILGDSGYPLEPWLMTPILNASDTNQQAYTTAHCSARSSVERCFGLLKATFRCLSKQRVLMYSPQRAGLIINACAVLHNMRLKHRLVELDEPADPEEDLAQPSVDIEETRARISEGRRVQQQLIAEHFRAGLH